MSVRVIIGTYKEQAIKSLIKTEPFATILPNLNPPRSMVNHCIERLREVYQGEEVYITTDSCSLIDNCMLNELLIANTNGPALPLAGRDLEAVQRAYDVGIQYVSEILIQYGLLQ